MPSVTLNSTNCHHFTRQELIGSQGEHIQGPTWRVHVPIYDIGSGAIGVLRDISETGLRVAGIESKVGQVKTFQIPIDMFMQADPLLIIAECKWVEIKGKTRNTL